MTPDQQRAEVIREIATDRVAAHAFLFKHRHPDATADHQREMILAWHDPAIPAVVTEAFREGAKSTTAEEVVIIRAFLQEFRNGLIVGASEEMAVDRLKAIRYEFENNEKLLEIFGDPEGSTWTDTRLELRNGVMIQARGFDQKMRGTKYRDIRPDFCLIDDLEDEDTVATPAQRKKIITRLYRTLLPALDKNALKRMTGNRLDEDAAIVHVANDKRWLHQRFPIKYRDEKGNWKATWPARFPLAWIEDKEQELREKGLLREFNIEYMLQASAPEDRAFKQEMIVVNPRIRTWDPVYAMFDPARTTTQGSAQTGYAAWSYRDPKIIVWEAWGKLLAPSQIIDEMFRCDEEFQPVAIGVERDGLEQWLMEPLRTQQTQRGRIIPVRAELAPRDRSKADFIKSIQPYFNAHEVEFAKPLPELEAQLVNFPSGLRDIVNALAFFTRLRDGLPVYEDFCNDHVAESLRIDRSRAPFLALNAGHGVVTGVLVQTVPQIRVVADWIEEGDAQAVRLIIEQACLLGAKPHLRAAPQHWERYSNVGLVQAIARIPAEVEAGTAPEIGRDLIRERLKAQTRGLPAFQVSRRARWTLNAFAGGYAKSFAKDGHMHAQAKEGPYRVLMEGLESFIGLLRIATFEGEREDVNYATTPDGRRFISARAS